MWAWLSSFVPRAALASCQDYRCTAAPPWLCRLLLDDPGGKGGEGGGGGETEDDVFLKKIESSMLAQVKLQGISGIRKVFLREAKRTRLDPAGGGFVTDNEWVLDTEGAVKCRWVVRESGYGGMGGFPANHPLPLLYPPGRIVPAVRYPSPCPRRLPPHASTCWR